MSTRKFSLPLFVLLLLLATTAGVLVFSTSLNKAIKEETVVLPAAPGNKVTFSDGQFAPSAFPNVWLGQEIAGLDKPLNPQPEAVALSGSSVLGDSTAEKWIEVDLTNQRIRAHEGDNIVYEFLVSTGKFAPTPTGEFNIWYKTKYTKMEGGIKGTGTYYYLSNVPYTMFFYQGFGIHGTYWHNNFGHPMSHGCVNVAIADAEKLFYWADPVLPDGKGTTRATSDNPGTRVVVHGVAPRS